MRKRTVTALLSITLFTACTNEGGVSVNTNTNRNSISTPAFQNVSVHDPSVVKADDTYYVFGSHLAAAKSRDLMSWTQVSSGVQDGNPLIPNVTEELRETLDWAQSDTLWAADVIQLADGKYYMYYNACKGDSPLSAMGIAISDHIEGPYKNAGIFLKSGMAGLGDDGEIYDATQKPNVVDPHVFFDKDSKLWMVYGSYSGGIFILEMDSKTGFPRPGQGYGQKLLGANHARIEGPYMLYSPETDYYYLFLSYGGLDANGGYNIRVARSKSPDGPFEDAEGQDMIDAKGTAGVIFDDPAYSPYGVKLLGNFELESVEGEGRGHGYVSPGHNSAYYDEMSGKYYLIFHTRFSGRGEEHEVRVHQMFLNSEGWPVVAPHRYAGETIGTYKQQDVTGKYHYVNHNKIITADIVLSKVIELTPDGQISGAVTGTWALEGEHAAELTIDGNVYKGVFSREWDAAAEQEVMTFTAGSKEGISIWGSHVSAATK
ncbi:extracellular endo-alpha-(1-_5)-L-arabinanase 2 [Paenibacillus albidus]|uniref:Extracellular endo-alpha-(1->5)-L-arabinanase 2 n=1 Tax=Paenibacillus albidus TaxID=2041023 RepID=A0A917C284_9BACL|nr:glycoside hydrolase family 43 protein [Paenibacillus albidus]GGF67171.1 extracellular endo-alpha-(1->5)-L-arabinanase 2 [Paenibacillus albidus]